MKKINFISAVSCALFLFLITLSVKAQTDSRLKGSGEVFFHETFDWGNAEDPEGWTLPGGYSLHDPTEQGLNWHWWPNDWLLAEFTNEPPFQSTSKDDGHLCLFLSLYNNGLPRNERLIVDNSIFFPSIDCSSRSSVILSYETNFQSYSIGWDMLIEVSNDNGEHWGAYDAGFGCGHKARPNGIGPGESTIFEVNITELAAGMPEVVIKITWVGTALYFWIIDDLKLSEAQDNDLKMKEYIVVWDDLNPLTNESPSAEIPISQLVEGHGFVFPQSTVENFGEFEQTGVNLGLQIRKNNVGVLNDNSPPINLSPGLSHTEGLPSKYSPDGFGRYIMDLAWTQNENENTPDDNKVAIPFAITDSVYSRADNTPESSFSMGLEKYNYGDGEEFWNIDHFMASIFPIYNPIEVDGLSVYITGGLADGLIDFKYSLYEAPPPGEDPNVVNPVLLLTSETLVLDPSMFNTWVYLPFNKDGGSEFLQGGKTYYAGIQYNNRHDSWMERRYQNIEIGSDKTTRTLDFRSIGWTPEGNYWDTRSFITDNNLMIKLFVDDHSNQPQVPGDWAVVGNEFAHDGEINAEVYIDDIPTNNPAGVLAAFVGDECRGVQPNGLSGPSGKFVYIIRCYSNASSGEALNFRYFNPDDGLIYNIEEQIEFVPDMTLGDALEPIHLHTYTTVSAERMFDPGWSWFSLNLQGEDMSINHLLQNITPSHGDYLKSQTKSATFYEGHGWFGELLKLNIRESYKIRLDIGGLLYYNGYPVNPSLVEIPVHEGWNWIGFVPQVSGGITTTLEGINPQELDFVKSQLHSATYYDASGWFGELTEMHPFEGYMLRSGKDAILTYPDGPVVPLASKGLQNSVAGCEMRVTGFNPASFEHSGQVTAEVILPGQNTGNVEDLLLTISGGKVVGQSSPLIFPPTGQAVFNHMTYGNSDGNREIEFCYYDSNEDQWYKFEEELVFKPDMIEANAYNPFSLEKARKIIDPLSPLTTLLSLEIFPNPISSSATISILSEEEHHYIQVLDIYNRVVQEISIHTSASGKASISWDTQLLANGVYFLRIKENPEIFTKVVISK